MAKTCAGSLDGQHIGDCPIPEVGTASLKVGTHGQTTTLLFGPVRPSVFFAPPPTFEGHRPLIPQNLTFSIEDYLQK